MEQSSQEAQNYAMKEHIEYLENLLKQKNVDFQSFQQKQASQEQQGQNNNDTQPFFSTNLNEKELTKQQIERYSRQMLLEEIGYEGQKKISQTKILVVGAGGIGAPALLYLAGMGVGNIGIIDDDRVEESNLHRQVIHNQFRVGVNKAESAKRTLQQFNQRVQIKTYEFRLNNQNANEIFKDYDIILDASDNPKTRYLVNDASITNKKILVSGSAIGWEGQLTVYGCKGGPCYRCLFPVSPKGSSVKSCGEAGVVGMIPGIIGQLEALEALKIILGRSGVLSQQLLLFDGQRASFKRVKLRPQQKNCQVCGENPTITNVEKFDYDEFISDTCTANLKPKTDVKSYGQITWEDFVELYKKSDQNLKDYQFVDVRFKSQHNIVHFKEFQSIPFDDIQDIKTQQEEINKLFDQNSKGIYIMCRRGINSQTISQLLVDNGYNNVHNIKGGIESYAKAFDSQIPFF